MDNYQLSRNRAQAYFLKFDQEELIHRWGLEHDQNFPASVTLLWDTNTLEFVFYETTFYIAGFLLKTLQAHMK